MTIQQKLIALIFCIPIWVSSVCAQNITWSADTVFQYGLSISGVGQPVGTIDSPSGFWQLNYSFQFFESGPVINLQQSESAAWFQPDPASGLVFPGYADVLFSPVPAQDWNTSDSTLSLGGAGWSGYLDIAITSQPNVNDPSTWQWVITSAGSGPPLDVPEPKWSIWLFVMAAIVRSARKARRAGGPVAMAASK